MIGLIIFMLGACSVFCIEQKMWILLGLTVIITFCLLIMVEKTFRKRNNELVIKKLCYIYVLLSVSDFVKGYENLSKNKIVKAMKRILREIATDVCGPGHYSTWIKWESFFRNKASEFFKEDNDELG